MMIDSNAYQRQVVASVAEIGKVSLPGRVRSQVGGVRPLQHEVLPPDCGREPRPPGTSASRSSAVAL